MQEESNVHVRDALPEHAGEKKKVVIVNHDDVAWFVDFQDAGSEFLVHAVIICPCLALCPTVRWFVLFVVEECVYFVLCKSSPARLVHQIDTSVRGTGLSIVAQPHRYGFASLVVRELPFQTSSVFLGNP